MIKIEALTLEDAFTDAAAALECSVSELKVEIVQVPRSGLFGLFKKKAIIVATLAHKESSKPQEPKEAPVEPKEEPKEVVKPSNKESSAQSPRMLNDTIIPASFVSDQDEEQYEDLKSGLEYTADYDDAYDENYEHEDELGAQTRDIATLVDEVEREINALFELTCFNIEKIDVSVYDEQTLLVEFSGEDAALLIGKEGYRYKALSYMLFNWLNSKYEIQLRLEIAEFLKNQEESVGRYLSNVYENIDRDGRAQTKILDGVLVQIALKELREHYPEKYVVIRSTKDGLKYIIINDYHSN